MLSKRERKKQKVTEHNRRYESKKARLLNMSEQEILDEQLALSVKKALVEIMPDARKLVV